MNILAQGRNVLLTDNYLIKVSEFVYGAKRWAITATPMRADINIIRLGEYSTGEEAQAAFDNLVKKIDKIEV